MPRQRAHHGEQQVARAQAAAGPDEGKHRTAIQAGPGTPKGAQQHAFLPGEGDGAGGDHLLVSVEQNQAQFAAAFVLGSTGMQIGHLTTAQRERGKAHIMPLQQATAQALRKLLGNEAVMRIHHAGAGGQIEIAGDVVRLPAFVEPGVQFRRGAHRP